MGSSVVRAAVFGLVFLFTLGGIALVRGTPAPNGPTTTVASVSTPEAPVPTPSPTSAKPTPTPLPYAILEPITAESEAWLDEGESPGGYPPGVEAFGCHPPDDRGTLASGELEEGDFLPSTVAPSAAGAPVGAGEAGRLGGPPLPPGVFSFTAKAGDSVSGLAGVFGISADTIRWANGLGGQEETLRVGQVLTILPVSGVLHEVVNGDTVGAIAATYAVDATRIAAANGLANPNAISVGMRLIVPGGEPRP